MSENTNPNRPLTLSFGLNGPGYIEASAGTGKTFTITCLITRLLLGSRDYKPVPLDKMLVMTFTRSAARDLRRKIRERLTEVMELFQDNADESKFAEDENQYLEPFCSLFGKSDRELRNRTARHILRDALTNIDKASISTIHSFCASMLKRHAISARIPFSQNLLTDDKATQKCAEAVREAVRELFYDKELTEEETDVLLKESEIFDDDKWQNTLTRLLENNYGPSFSLHRYDGADRLTQAKSLKEMLRIMNEMTQEQNDQIEKLADELNEVCPIFFKVKFNKIGNVSGGMLDSAYSADKCVTFFRACIMANKDEEKLLDFLGNNVNGQGKGKPHLTNFNEAKNSEKFAPLIGDIESALKTSFSLKPLVYDKVLTRASEILEEKKDIEGFLFQNDLLSRLKDALVKQDQGEDTGIPGLSSSEILREAILADYPVAIIDEFQDTDPIQFSIVSQVYLNYFKANKEPILSREPVPEKRLQQDVQGFYIIGDPKQSIYLFRGADVSCYNDAVKGIRDFWGENDQDKNHQGTLDTNFRSNPVLVYQVNSMFAGLDLSNTTDSGALAKPKHSAKEDYYRSYIRGGSWEFREVKAVTERPDKKDKPQKFLVLATDAKAKVLENSIVPAPLTVFCQKFVATSTEKDGTESVNIGYAQKKLAESCAREIVEVLNRGWIAEGMPDSLTQSQLQQNKGRMVELKDIAVLVSSSKEAAYISGELARYGVPAVYTSNRMSITDTLEFESVYNLMEAFLNPKDNEKLRFLVSSSFFNYTAQDISGELSNGFEDISAALAEGAGLWRDNDFMSAYCFFTKKLHIAEKLSQSVGGEAVITNLNQAAEIAQSLSSRASSFDGIVSLYRRLMDEPESDDSAQEMSDYSIRAGGNENVIRITTYHSSKGLEYNIVFMPYAGIWKTTKKAKKGGFSPVSYLDSDAPEGEGRLRYDITGDQDLAIQHDWNEMGESLRLWYVAATRAKYAMFLWTGVFDSGSYLKPYRDNPGKYYLPLYVQLRNMCRDGNKESSAAQDPADNKDQKKLSNALASLFMGNAKNRENLARLQEINRSSLAELRPPPKKWPVNDDNFFLIESLSLGAKTKWDDDRRKRQLGDSNPKSGVRPFEGNIPNNWRILSYSALVGAKTHHGAARPDIGDTGGEDENHNAEDIPEVSRDDDDPRIAIRGGIDTGLFLHGIFERLSFDDLRDDRTKLEELREQPRISRQDLLDSIKAARVIAERLDTFPDSGEWSQDDRKFLNLLEWILCAAETPLKAGSNENAAPFALRDLRDNHTVKEMEFYMRVPRIKNMAALNNIVRSKEYAEDKYVGNLYHRINDDIDKEQVITANDVQGFMTGSLDLFFEHDGKYYVADYKSNIITENRNKQGLYNREAMQRTIYDSHYDFQYVIYTVAMHRFLKHKLGDSYDYDTHIGGIYYLFLRGMRGENSEINGSVPGVYYVRLPRELVEKADKFFANAENNEKGDPEGSAGNPESDPKQNNQKSGKQQMSKQ
ncbi:UvrD-helicase domain-containing protein [Succinimonas sp.]|uniref:UvrD-helicase domain-containing protein n=1 Tax=Succinimonas sp. TaxID=1936151 RepID=UPI003869E31F